MEIKENGIYKIANKNIKEIYVKKNITSTIFLKNISQDITINMQDNSKVDMFGFFYNKCPLNITINQNKKNSTFHFNSIFIDDKTDLKSNILSNISGEKNEIYIYIIGIARNSTIDINSAINVNKIAKGVNARLELENIFVGTEGKIKSIPSLFVDTNDVSVSHASKTHRIDKSSLYYIKSRGINEKNGILLIINGYFRKCYKKLEKDHNNIYKNIYKKFLNLN